MSYLILLSAFTAAILGTIFIYRGLGNSWAAERRLKRVAAASSPSLKREISELPPWITRLSLFGLTSAQIDTLYDISLERSRPKAQAILWLFKVRAATATAFAAGSIGIGLSVSEPTLGFASSLGGGLSGWFAPTGYLIVATRRRYREISKSIPDVIELLLLCLDSGLALEVSLRRVAKEVATSAPLLSFELLRTIDELDVFGAAQVAFARLAERVPTKSLQDVTRIIIQSLDYGSPIVTTFKTALLLTRQTEALKLEERTARFPNYIMIITLLFIFPALLGVLVGPGALRFVYDLDKDLQ